MSDRYRVEWMENGLIRVFDYASKFSGCYNADGSYRHGDLYAETLVELLNAEIPPIPLRRCYLPSMSGRCYALYCRRDLVAFGATIRHRRRVRRLCKAHWHTV